MTGKWQLIRQTGSAGLLHTASADSLGDDAAGRMIRVLEADGPALVLGSHQPQDHFDPRALAAAGVVAARRRSGGSAVLVGPGRVVWVDLILARGDALWDDDISRGAWWVGDLWASALGEAGVGTGVWKGSMRRGPWSDVVCFAGLGPGEVTVGGRKVVGLSQRRTARGVLFQTALMVRWDPREYTALLSAEMHDRPPAALRDVAAGVGPEVAARALAALLRRLVT